MLEDLGNCVRIHETVIPAVNIQVEGFPKFIGDDWYGIYFEIMVEDGGLYILTQYHPDGAILRVYHPFWGTDGPRCEIPVTFQTWEKFLAFWEARAKFDAKQRTYDWEHLMAEMAA